MPHISHPIPSPPTKDNLHKAPPALSNHLIKPTSLNKKKHHRMSTFGAPGTGVKIGRPNPPAKGSFPLDHDAECQPLMKQYLRCLKTARGVNSPECRELSKGYLSCRMERGLMAPDEMKNLGYGEGQTATDDVGKGVKR
jgi:cytochrome c oxidase assembly protein subunit 19